MPPSSPKLVYSILGGTVALRISRLWTFRSSKSPMMDARTKNPEAAMKAAMIWKRTVMKVSCLRSKPSGGLNPMPRTSSFMIPSHVIRLPRYRSIFQTLVACCLGPRYKSRMQLKSQSTPLIRGMYSTRIKGIAHEKTTFTNPTAIVMNRAPRWLVRAV